MRFLHASARVLSIAAVPLLVLVSVAVPLALAAKTEKVATATYRVYGSTENQIRASLNARRPGDYDAKTAWFIDWSYTSIVRDGRCRVNTSKVNTRINFTYPRWVAPAGATEELTTKWNRYMSRLRVHEAGHATTGRTTATRIQNTLNVTSAADCTALDRSLKATIKRHFQAGNAADIAYDKRTKHGETQGAVFP